MEHLRTRKTPKQSIPTFAETVTLLMLVRPPNQRSPLLNTQFAVSPLSSLSHDQFVAGEPPCQVQHRREGAEQPGAAVHADGQDHQDSAGVGDGARAAAAPRSMAPSLPPPRQNAPAVLPEVIYRHQPRYRAQILLGRRRRVLYQLWLVDDGCWCRVSTFAFPHLYSIPSICAHMYDCSSCFPQIPQRLPSGGEEADGLDGERAGLHG